MSERRLGLFGGSFDPIHTGHLYAARAAQRAFELDRVVFVPAAQPPHKPGRRLAPGRDRLAMIELAIAAEPSWSSCDLELERSGPSYTVDTVRALPARVGEPPEVQLFLILGSDNLDGLPGWHRAAELFELVQPVVVPREGTTPDQIERILARCPAAWRRKLRAGLLDVPEQPGRSSDLRAALGAQSGATAALPPEVAEYIRSRGLYPG